VLDIALHTTSVVSYSCLWKDLDLKFSTEKDLGVLDHLTGRGELYLRDARSCQTPDGEKATALPSARVFFLPLCPSSWGICPMFTARSPDVAPHLRTQQGVCHAVPWCRVNSQVAGKHRYRVEGKMVRDEVGLITFQFSRKGRELTTKTKSVSFKPVPRRQ